MIVVDTNIIACMTFPTVYSPVVSALHEKNPIWEAPSLWKSEFLNVLSLYLRKGVLDHKDSLDALDFAERLIGGREHAVPAKDIVEALVRSTCSASDCEFVVLAERLGARLITYDEKLVREFPNVATTPDAYLAL